MARKKIRSCDSGQAGYDTKAEAEANGGKAKRCDRCKQWHIPTVGGKRRMKQKERKAKTY